MRGSMGRSLDRDLLFARALAIVDAEGLGALTMRRLATDLGVKAPSLYNHVSGKDELLEGALRVMRSEVHAPSDAGSTDWKSSLAAIFSEYRRVLAAHPNMMPLAGHRLSGSDSGLEFLIARGFSVDQAVELWQSLLALAVGFSMFTSGYAFSDAPDLSAELDSRSRRWDDETCNRALLALMDSYDDQRGPDDQPDRAPD